MSVEALDHINICTKDVAGTAAFFVDVLGMTASASPGAGDIDRAAWIRDDADRPIIHLASEDVIRSFMGDPAGGGGSGRIHHVALRCSDHDGVVARLEARGASYRQSGMTGRRVLFVEEVNGILLELNFLDD